MRGPAVIAAVLLLNAGCLSPAPRPATAWMLEVAPAVTSAPTEPKSMFAATRLGTISVLAPYNRADFTVHRPDGSVAFDPDNAFAATPSTLLTAPLIAALAGDGRFGEVVMNSSMVSADAIVEVTVAELALDCRDETARKARAALALKVIKNGRNREVMLSGSGTGEADAAAGNYSTAFSKAVNTAVNQALMNLR